MISEMGNVVMLVGLGNLGEHILELLARIHGIAKIVGLDINKESGMRKVRNAKAGASLQVVILASSLSNLI